MKPLSQNDLHESALEYLTHRSASVSQLRTVLHRRIAAWARRAAKLAKAPAEADASFDGEVAVERLKELAEAVLERLTSSGLLNDAAYAKNRAERLTRDGHSRRAVEFDLKKKGIASGLAKDAVPRDPQTELAAAVALLRKKRFGPFTRKSEDEVDAKERNRWLSALARAGFSFSTADRALRMDREAADDLVRSLR